jgi:hypothetical protein
MQQPNWNLKSLLYEWVELNEYDPNEVILLETGAWTLAHHQSHEFKAIYDIPTYRLASELMHPASLTVTAWTACGSRWSSCRESESVRVCRLMSSGSSHAFPSPSGYSSNDGCLPVCFPYIIKFLWFVAILWLCPKEYFHDDCMRWAFWVKSTS